MNRNKELFINMSASFIAYIVSIGISFFLSPYVIETIGVEAYGFVGLANNFISYAGLITIALNSLAGRFITISIYEKDMRKANKYFTSVFYANLILTAVMGLFMIAILIYLDKLINIPKSIEGDVKVLFAVLFANCLLGTVTSVFSVATFATNKLYIDSIRTIEGNIIKVIVTVGLFILFVPKVCYIGITALITGVYSALFKVYYAYKLTPELKIKKKYFDIKAVWQLLTSGIWNLITRLGTLLLDGLDLLITNLFIDSVAMGVLSIAKIIPTAINGIVGTLVGIFSPDFTILYAEKKYNELVSAVKQSMKIMGIICNLPIIILIVCGEQFFNLWQPTQDARQLQILSILTCAGLIFNGGINSIYNIFTVVNKLKFNSILVCACGAVSTSIVFILLKITNLGVYAVAGVSTSVLIIKNVLLIVPYGAKCLKQKWHTFYPSVIRPVIFVVISSAIGYTIKGIFPFGGWFDLILFGLIVFIISVFIGMFIILNKNDRDSIAAKIRKRG